MANPTVTPIMTPARGPNVPDAQPVYLVDVYGNPIMGAEASIATYIRNGQGFIYSSANGLVTATNPNLLVCGLSIFNPGSPKNILIYSILAYTAGGSPLQATTANPSGTTGFTGTGMAATNAKLGGSGSVASLSVTPTGVTVTVAAPGTFLSILGSASVGQELLPNGAMILLPAGANNGIAIMLFVATAGGGFGAVAKGIEF